MSCRMSWRLGSIVVVFIDGVVVEVEWIVDKDWPLLPPRGAEPSPELDSGAARGAGPSLRAAQAFDVIRCSFASIGKRGIGVGIRGKAI